MSRPRLPRGLRRTTRTFSLPADLLAQLEELPLNSQSRFGEAALRHVFAEREAAFAAAAAGAPPPPVQRLSPALLASVPRPVPAEVAARAKAKARAEAKARAINPNALTEDKVGLLEDQAVLAERASAAQLVLARNEILARVLDGSLPVQSRDLPQLLRALVSPTPSRVDGQAGEGAPPLALLYGR